jgi:hypothetical protein
MDGDKFWFSAGPGQVRRRRTKDGAFSTHTTHTLSLCWKQRGYFSPWAIVYTAQLIWLSVGHSSVIYPYRR